MEQGDGIEQTDFIPIYLNTNCQNKYKMFKYNMKID
jgi:hypothetical protein